jgi:hypothetical protein
METQKTRLTLNEKKRLYVQLIETRVRFGWDISELLNPVYSRLNVPFVIDHIIQMYNDSSEFFELDDEYFLSASIQPKLIDRYNETFAHLISKH